MPPPLVFGGDVCETSSNKLSVSGEVGGLCTVCTRVVFGDKQQIQA